MKKFLMLLLISMSAQASEFVPLLELRTMWGIRIQLSNDEGWCSKGEKTARMFDGAEKKDGCWSIDSSGEVISISWPNQITNHPRRMFRSLEV